MSHQIRQRSMQPMHLARQLAANLIDDMCYYIIQKLYETWLTYCSAAAFSTVNGYWSSYTGSECSLELAISASVQWGICIIVYTTFLRGIVAGVEESLVGSCCFENHSLDHGPQ